MKQKLIVTCCLLMVAGCSNPNLLWTNNGVARPIFSHTPKPADPVTSQPAGEVRAQTTTGSSAYYLSDGKHLKGGHYMSRLDDENVLRAQGSISATLRGVHVQKTGGRASSLQAADFYGDNAALLALDKARLKVSGGHITATAPGASGVFAYNGAHIELDRSQIKVSGEHAAGLQVAAGGHIDANRARVEVDTNAAIRSGRGGGEINIDGGDYVTRGGEHAPVVYSTSEITIHNATLTARQSEALVIEGEGSVILNNSRVSGHMQGTYRKNSDHVIANVLLYQRQSQDSPQGITRLAIDRGTLASQNGDMFYVTNTRAIINLKQVDLRLAHSTSLLRVAGNNDTRKRWGRSGYNGASCELNAINQVINGDIQVDAISALSVNLSRLSSYHGAINPQGTKASSLVVSLDASSRWVLTADSYISALHGRMDNIDFNGHTLYVGGKPFSAERAEIPAL